MIQMGMRDKDRSNDFTKNISRVCLRRLMRRLQSEERSLIDDGDSSLIDSEGLIEDADNTR